MLVVGEMVVSVSTDMVSLVAWWLPWGFGCDVQSGGHGKVESADEGYDVL